MKLPVHASINADSTIGHNVKRIRRSKSITLQELSKASGVSIATLSKIENVKVKGSFNTIYKIARGLGVLVTEIVSAAPRSRAKPAKVLARRAKRPEVHHTDIYDYFVQAGQPQGRLNSYMMVIHTREVPDLCNWSIHDGEEVIYVMQGCVELHVCGQKPVILAQGDSASFDCGRRHAFVSKAAGPARILSVSTRPPSR